MKIDFIKLNKGRREFAFTWAKHLKILVIGIWFAVIILDFGMKYRERMTNKRSDYIKNAMNRSCGVCNLPLTVGSVYQIIKYHKCCRPLRHKKLSEEELNSLKERVKIEYHVK